MQRGLTTRKLSVCLSVRLSVKRAICDRTKESCAHILILHDTLSWFCDKKNGWWGRTHLPEILGQTDPVGAKSPIFSRYSLYGYLAKQ